MDGPAAVNGEKPKFLPVGPFSVNTAPKVCAWLKATLRTASTASVTKKKLRIKLLDLKRWFNKMLHTPVKEMWPTLNAKLRGHYQYYGINDNWPLLMVYREKARRMAKRHLSRRSQNSDLNWDKFNAFEEQHPLASPQRLTNLIAMSRQGVK